MIIALFIAILGLCFGSFVTAASWRLPKGKGMLTTRSECPKCKKKLRPQDLIPVISYLISKGKCARCGKKISLRYPATEIITSALFLINYFKFGLTTDFVIFSLLAVALMVLIVSDLEEFIIPDSTTIATLVAAGLYKYQHNIAWQDGLIAGVTCFLFAWALGFVFKKIKNKDALGFGDVKFMGAAGFWLGLLPLPIYFILSGVIGILMGLVWKYAFKQPIFPFGPALAAALYIMLLV